MTPTALRCLLFDLDDTLYPPESGVWDMVRVRINQYLQEKIGFSPEEVGSIRQRLYRQYGTTLRGLQKEFAVDMDDYLEYVHDIPLETVLKPDQKLNQILSHFPQRKVIFTNAHTPHALRVLQALAIERYFEKIVDIRAVQPYCKPDVEAFHKALTIIDEKAEDCLLIDDSPKNLQTAHALGMSTVSVGPHPLDGITHIKYIHNLPQILSR